VRQLVLTPGDYSYNLLPDGGVNSFNRLTENYYKLQCAYINYVESAKRSLTGMVW